MQEEKLGSVKVSDDMLMICAANAAQGIAGVSRLGGGLAGNLSGGIFGILPAGKGVKLSHCDGGIFMDVYVIVEYGVKIPQLAWEIQSVVKKEIERITSEKVSVINIHVQGVDPREENSLDKDRSKGIYDAGVLPDGGL